MEISERGKRYAYYIKSREWAAKRAERLQIDNGRCVVCGKEAAQVHHLHYETLGSEDPLNDLISVCSYHHKFFDDIERVERYKRIKFSSTLRGGEGAKRNGVARSKVSPEVRVPDANARRHHDRSAAPDGKAHEASVRKAQQDRQRSFANGRDRFLAALYVTAGVGISLPGDNIERMLIEAAKKSRSGKAASAGMYVMEDAKLIYDGPQDPNDLWECGKFSHRKAVRVGQARLMRTRPIFQSWEASTEVSFDDEIVSRADVLDWMAIAGRYIGFGDWRPRFGRFSSEVIN